MGCDGFTCTRYKASKPVSGGRYANGQKRCQVCEIYMNFNGLVCPCCNFRLRSKPRNVKYKAKLEEAKTNNEFQSFGINMGKAEVIVT